MAKVKSGPIDNKTRLAQTISHLISRRSISSAISTKNALINALKIPSIAAEVVRTIVNFRSERQTTQIARAVKIEDPREYNNLSNSLISVANSIPIESLK